MSSSVLIRGGAVAAWVDGKHAVLPRGDVLVEGDSIRAVGASLDARADREVDASGKFVIPGLINIHSHVTDTAFTRDFLEESTGLKDFTNLYRILPAVRNATDARDACIGARALLVEALLGGTTTIVELGYDSELQGATGIENAESVARIAIDLGLRCYSAPRYRRGFWRGDAGGKVAYHDYADAGRARMEECLAYCARLNGAFGDRLRTMLAPGQVDTCDIEMLTASRTAANTLGLPVQLHAGQSPTEFRRVLATTGMTTIRLLEKAGLLGADFIIGHGMFLAETSDIGSIPAEEMALLRDSGTTIGHLPWVKMRQGTLMNSYGKFLRAGVNVALGTDTHPVDMVHEIRTAAIGCKLAEQSQQATTALDAFNLATVNGARALGRRDLGRIEAGCKADLVLIDMRKPRAAGYDDPFKYLVYNADGGDVDAVLVGGALVVEDGRPVNADLAEVVANMNEAKKRVVSRLQL